MNLNIVKRLVLLCLLVTTALPSHGRFISEDDWEGQHDAAPSLHKYLYAYQNPTVYVDVDGNAPVLAEMASGLFSQVGYINRQAAAYRKQGDFSGHLSATMMNVGAGFHAVLGGAVGLVNAVADIGISSGATHLEYMGEEFRDYGVVADSRANLSDIGKSLERVENTVVNIGDRNVRAELGRGGVETFMGAFNGDPDALNRFATASASLGVGGGVSKLNPTRLANNPSNPSSNLGLNHGLVVENVGGLAPKLNINRQPLDRYNRQHSNGRANSTQYSNLKDYYASLDSDYVPLSNKKLDGNNDPRNHSLANSTHPVTGVRFTPDGYPDFEPDAIKTVQIKQTGNSDIDFRNANIEAGIGLGTRSHAKETPGYTWHHHQNGIDMQLIKTNPTHEKTGHSGGAEIERRAGGAKSNDRNR